MIRINENYTKLKASYLFSDIAKRVSAYTAANPGQVCPAKWKEGAKTLAPSLDLVGKI